ncbi:uncharacterized protein LOC115621230 [Scaptodrosophila lebanonensis]|uniref:Uncharacterized protein LOC115621230 n=1 Tax=Drosophila lebanonensis TaxID=7225 RepID=A0A6J2T3V7_DROLE|nr:uncharacterized protein LOC115621230 [Scaptodrosophila lebanonensis]
MMSPKQSFISRNLIAIVMVPSLIGIHMGWSYMQNNRKLVTADEQIDLPVVTLAKYLWGKLTSPESERTNSPK